VTTVESEGTIIATTPITIQVEAEAAKAFAAASPEEQRKMQLLLSLRSSATVAELNDVLRRPRFDTYVHEDERLAFLATVLGRPFCLERRRHRNYQSDADWPDNN
jgi:hypothetical protein